MGANLFLGTSSFTANGWQGTFYPRGMKAAEYSSYYAEHFSTVEIDATFYACPAARTVANWEARVPEGFVFAVKAPQVITHEKILRDCGAELGEFLKTMDLLGPKLGPIVLQFPFFGRAVLPDRHAFTDRLVPFLKKLPGGYRFAVEIRNHGWLDAELCNLLRDHRVALVLQDRSWMSDPEKFAFDPITAEWTYIRWLGDRKWVGEEARFDKEVIDRTEELSLLGGLLLPAEEARGVAVRVCEQSLFGVCAGDDCAVSEVVERGGAWGVGGRGGGFDGEEDGGAGGFVWVVGREWHRHSCLCGRRMGRGLAFAISVWCGSV